MTLQSELENLNNAVQKLKMEVRRALLRQLGVDKLVRRAFGEGWQMGREMNPYYWDPEKIADFQKEFVWCNEKEAWVNSETEEQV